MSLEFFTQQQSFGNSLNGFTSQVGAKQTVAKNKNALSTLKTKESSAQEDSFEKYLNSEKSKTHEKQETAKVKANAAQSTKGDVQAGLDKLSLVANLLTRENSTTVKTDASTSDDSSALPLELLSSKLQALIDETIANQNQASETSEAVEQSTLIQTIEGAADAGDDENALQALLKGLVVQILGKDPEQEDISTDEDLTVILGGLTPQEITDLKSQINAFLTSERNEEDEAALAALLSQFYALAQPEKRAEAKTDNTAKTITDNVLKTDLQSDRKEQSAAQQAANDDASAKSDRYETRYDARYDSSRPQTDSAGKEIFESTLKNVDAKATVKAEQPAASDNTQSASQRFLQTSTSAIQSSLGGLDGALAQSGQATSPANVVQNAMTNVTTQAQSATQSHPATQLVSITIQKAVKAGEDTNIKLRLDPPELGRVEVKMSIDKNNAKIVLTAEKPETFMMLQRDADALHRALADAGIESGGDLSFELASENHDFNQNQGGNGRSGGGRGVSDDNEQIVQSTMDWYVDPDTGRMHYNILA